MEYQTTSPDEHMMAEPAAVADGLQPSWLAERPIVRRHEIAERSLHGITGWTFRGQLAATLELEVTRVSVKFKTAEGVGPVGEGRGARRGHD